MSFTLADQYYLQALAHYPYSQNEVLIALGYALSYDEYHPQAHCLMGRLLMEQVKDYRLAAHHFEISLIHAPDFVDTYKYYSLLMIWVGQYESAEALIRRGMKVPGMRTSVMQYNRAVLFEMQGRLDHAIRMMRVAAMTECTVEGHEFLEGEIARLKNKATTLQSPQILCESTE